MLSELVRQSSLFVCARLILCSARCPHAVNPTMVCLCCEQDRRTEYLFNGTGTFFSFIQHSHHGRHPPWSHHGRQPPGLLQLQNKHFDRITSAQACLLVLTFCRGKLASLASPPQEVGLWTCARLFALILIRVSQHLKATDTVERVIQRATIRRHQSPGQAKVLKCPCTRLRRSMTTMTAMSCATTL